MSTLEGLTRRIIKLNKTDITQFWLAVVAEFGDDIKTDDRWSLVQLVLRLNTNWKEIVNQIQATVSTKLTSTHQTKIKVVLQLFIQEIVSEIKYHQQMQRIVDNINRQKLDAMLPAEQQKWYQQVIELELQEYQQKQQQYSTEGLQKQQQQQLQQLEQQLQQHEQQMKQQLQQQQQQQLQQQLQQLQQLEQQQQQEQELLQSRLQELQQERQHTFKQQLQQELQQYHQQIQEYQVQELPIVRQIVQQLIQQQQGIWMNIDGIEEGICFIIYCTIRTFFCVYLESKTPPLMVHIDGFEEGICFIIYCTIRTFSVYIAQEVVAILDHRYWYQVEWKVDGSKYWLTSDQMKNVKDLLMMYQHEVGIDDDDIEMQNE